MDPVSAWILGRRVIPSSSLGRERSLFGWADLPQPPFQKLSGGSPYLEARDAFWMAARHSTRAVDVASHRPRTSPPAEAHWAATAAKEVDDPWHDREVSERP
ncbi:uncharacterized protein E0L32_008059 [Thyridium curvatum]|uniref:Uncharacterized protein n=1 Tax=Thyridium curvatum TaxID=1093900 RepID=A0A507AMF5_9PEZI|nr:uncharacterized protein E0L32_008059 [Thyridium curvatum]TPX11022.1 hypothetical protein E0L32_008059 [Thyridium curvatum]